MVITLFVWLCSAADMADCQVYAVGQWEGPKAAQQCEAARQVYRETMRAPTPFNRLFCEAE